VADPQQHISQLTLLTPSEQQRILVEWNNTQAIYPNKCAHELFEEQVARTPDDTAVTFNNERLSYQELNSRANQLAHRLRSLGVGPDVPVGLSIDRSLEMVVGLLGILKAGGAYIPLDPGYPRERLAFMLADSQLPVLLTQQALLDALPEQGKQLLQEKRTVLCLDTDWASIAQESSENPKASVTPHNLAYMIYTSGSTGQPKGVQIPHAALVNFLSSMREQPGLQAGDTLLAVTTISFDIAALEIFLPLTTGAHLVLLSRESAMDGDALIKHIEDSNATVMQATPATWRLLLDNNWQGKPDLKILCGGEALPRALADQLLTKAAAVWNLYGPTETTIWSTLSPVQSGDEPINIGRPIANTQVYILDANLMPVPVGVPGDLYIGGAGIARGYYHRPELTAERFIPNPFSQEPGARLYRTGDVARFLIDGNIEFQGRNDQQVKVRGYRIELDEIESALRAYPQVQNCIVTVQEEISGEKRLLAYIVAGQGQTVRSHELHSYLKERLPEYMVPSLFVYLDALPLTPNGKLDRRALPEPGQSAERIEDEYVAPRTPMEEQLCTIWADVLGLKRVGIYQNFFTSGGHSLLITQILTRVQERFQVNLPVRTLFKNPTIAGLAESIEKTQARSSELRNKSISSVSRDAYRQKQTAFAGNEKPASPFGHSK
jgi:amino acid adenylation domain-containing protein